MAVAGKVAITLSTENGGAWSADVTYDRLVAVKHNNNLYISRKTVANVEPPNNEFWFLALEGFSGDDIEDIINGTTQVGNAKTLDGHGAEYFAKSGFGLGESANIVDSWDNATLPGFYISKGNAPTSDYAHGVVFSNSELLITQIVTSRPAGNTEQPQTYVRTNNRDGVWSEWKQIATILDLANYLPLTGGTVGDGTKAASLSVRGSSSYSLIDYMNDANNIRWGCLGFAGANNPYFLTGDRLNGYALLHTGNKPAGTYTGTGETKTINTGGIGDCAIVWRDDGLFSILTYGGVINGGNDGAVSTGTGANCKNGNITVAGSDKHYNEAGVTYKYRLL